jgi:hypothetical protein
MVAFYSLILWGLSFVPELLIWTLQGLVLQKKPAKTRTRLIASVAIATGIAIVLCPRANNVQWFILVILAAPVALGLRLLFFRRRMPSPHPDVEPTSEKGRRDLQLLFYTAYAILSVGLASSVFLMLKKPRMPGWRVGVIAIALLIVALAIVQRSKLTQSEAPPPDDEKTR